MKTKNVSSEFERRNSEIINRINNNLNVLEYNNSFIEPVGAGISDSFQVPVGSGKFDGTGRAIFFLQNTMK